MQNTIKTEKTTIKPRKQSVDKLKNNELAGHSLQTLEVTNQQARIRTRVHPCLVGGIEIGTGLMLGTLGAFNMQDLLKNKDCQPSIPALISQATVSIGSIGGGLALVVDGIKRIVRQGRN